MAKQNPLQHILEKPLSRREFLQHLGVFFLAAVGVSGLISRLMHADHQISHKTSRGWGGGKFGGGGEG